MAKPLNIGRVHDHDGNEIRNFRLWLMTTANRAAALITEALIAFDTTKQKVIVKTTSGIEEVVFREKQKEISENYTILPEDDRMTIFITAGITITINNTLPDGFYCNFYSVTGPSTFTAGTANVAFPDGAILESSKVASLFKRDSTGTYIVKGELTTI